MYGILGEDRSDVEVIDRLIRRISKNERMRIKEKAYDGCGDLLCKGARAIQTLYEVGVSKFVICYDSDDGDPNEKYNEVVRRIIQPSNVDSTFCALIPVREIESWLLADLDAVKKVFTSFRVDREIRNPEKDGNPKRTLEKLLRREDNKPCYSGSVFNSKIAAYTDLKLLAERCPSSVPLFELIKLGKGNYPPPPESIKNRQNMIVKEMEKTC